MVDEELKQAAMRELARRELERRKSQTTYEQGGEGLGLSDQELAARRQAVEEQMTRGPMDVSPETGETKLSEQLIGAGRGFTELGQGAKQTYLMATGTPEESEAYTQQILAEQQAWEASPVGGSNDAQAFKFLAQAAPGLVIPGSIGASAVSKVATAGALGGLYGLTNITEDAGQKVFSALTSAGLSSAFAASSELYNHYRNYAMSRIKDATLNPDLKQKVDEAITLSGTDEAAVAAGGQRYPLSAAEQTLDPVLLEMDDYVKGAPGSINKALSYRLGQVKRAVDEVNTNINQLGGAKDPAVIGDNIKDAYESAVKGLDTVRDNMWKYHMDKAKQMVGDKKVFTVINFKQKLDDIITEYDNPTYGSASVRIANELKKIRRGFFKETSTGGVVPVDKVSIDGFKNLMSNYSKKASGDGRLFSEFVDSKTDKVVAKRLIGALKQDLSASEKGFADLGATELREARKSYLLNTKAITDIQKSTLGKMFDTKNVYDGEVVYGKLINMHPSAQKKAIDLIDQIDPGILDNVRATVLNNALVNSKQVGKVIDYDVKTFLKNLPKDDQFDMLFSGYASKGELADTMNYIRRISNTANVEKTAGFIREAEQSASAGVSLHPVFTVKALIKYGSPKYIANILYDPNRRMAAKLAAENMEVITKNYNKYIPGIAELIELSEATK